MRSEDGTLAPCGQPRVAAMNGAGGARRILLIEDNEDANESLCMLLRHEGPVVTPAFDGIAGLGLARTQVFDVLLCDIGLPGMDGLELITRLRSSLGLHIPFAIAISGDAGSAERERAIGAGFGHYFVKPVDVPGLLALVASDAVTRFIAAATRMR
jgi:CheY-like chemotaxis protein